MMDENTMKINNICYFRGKKIATIIQSFSADPCYLLVYFPQCYTVTVKHKHICLVGDELNMNISNVLMVKNVNIMKYSTPWNHLLHLLSPDLKKPKKLLRMSPIMVNIIGIHANLGYINEELLQRV